MKKKKKNTRGGFIDPTNEVDRVHCVVIVTVKMSADPLGKPLSFIVIEMVSYPCLRSFEFIFDLARPVTMNASICRRCTKSRHVNREKYRRLEVYRNTENRWRFEQRQSRIRVVRVS